MLGIKNQWITTINILKSFLLVSGLLLSSCIFATTLTDVSYNTIQNDEIKFTFTFSESLALQPAVETSVEPAFVIMSFNADDFDRNLAYTEVSHAGVEAIKVKKLGGRVVVTILMDNFSVFDVSQVDNTFSIVLNKGVAPIGNQKSQSIATSFVNNIDTIDFRKTEDGAAQLVVDLTDSMLAVNVKDHLGKLHVEFYNTEIANDLLYTLDVTDFGTIVQEIETFKEDKNTLFVLEMSDKYEFIHEQENNHFLLTVSEKEEEKSALQQINDFSGQPISLNFQDISIRTVLQIIADHNDFNLVISDTVSGNITLRLDGVPWDQALDIILKVKGLDKRINDNILLVAPSDELASREAKELETIQQAKELAPLYSEYIQINYAKAAELSNLMKNEQTSILSSRGSVSVDERTNTLLIRDTAQSIEDIKRMISVLDVAVRQVVIESRMVTVSDDINEELGVRWGITDEIGSDSSISGTLEGIGNGGGLSDRLNVNLPTINPAGSVAFQVARLANGTILDLELSALEQENKAEIIASPRLTTANQQEAYIEQGVEIPFQEASSSGATTTQFKKAVLSLTVTPQITPDDRIILDLVVTQDTVSQVTNGEAPAIDTQRIGTQVLVNNGETIVLGGIYQQSVISSVSKVPVLGDIPVVGSLFKNSNNFNEKTELLIFVTPRIVTDRF